MTPDTLAEKREAERARLFKLGVTLLNVYVALGIAGAVYQSATNPMIERPTKVALQSTATPYELGVRISQRLGSNRRLMITAQGIDFFARQLCPEGLTAPEREQWMSEFRDGYSSGAYLFAGTDPATK
jgi:hypothetical protein